MPVSSNPFFVDNSGTKISGRSPRRLVNPGIINRQALLALVKASPTSTSLNAPRPVASGRTMTTANRALSEYHRILATAP